MFMKNGWKPNAHMPPHDPGSLAEDLRELLTAWQKGPDNVENAQWIIPPAQRNAAKIVGTDYPYPANFNEANEKKKAAVDKRPQSKSLEKLGMRLKELVKAEKLTAEEALDLYKAAAEE